MKHPDKCCVECRHFYLHTGSRGYSEYTAGSDFDMECQKNRWTYEMYGTEEHYRSCILFARNCDDFEDRK